MKRLLQFPRPRLFMQLWMSTLALEADLFGIARRLVARQFPAMFNEWRAGSFFFFLSLFLWPFNNDVQFNLGGGHLHLSSVRCSSLGYFAFGPGELCMRPACRKANFD